MARTEARGYRTTIGLDSQIVTIGAIGAIGVLSGCEGARTPSDTIGAIGRAIGAIGAHYHMLRDHAKVTMNEVELNHIQMYVAATKEFLNHWTASTPLTFGRRQRRRSDCVDADKRA